MEKKNVFLRDCILKDLQILLWGVVSLLCALVLVLECVSADTEQGISVQERFEVSSALINKTQQNYTSAVSGVLYNPTDDIIHVENVLITVGGDDAMRGVEVEGFLLPPRTQKEIYRSWEGLDAFSRVTRIAVTVNGEQTVVSNIVQQTVSVSLVLPIAFFALAVFLLVRSVKGRYYLWQESKM